MREHFGNTSETLRKYFGDKEMVLLLLIIFNKDITAKEAAKVIGVSDRTIETYFTKLKSKNIIERIGSATFGGYWTLKKIKAYDKDCFKFSDNFSRITFPKSTSGAIGGAIESLTERQVEILELIKKNNKIAYREVAQRLEINNSAVQAQFDTLKEKSIIERIGGTRGYWKVLKR